MLMAQQQQTAGRPGDCSNPLGALGVRRGSSVVTSPSSSCRDASDQRGLSVHSPLLFTLLRFTMVATTKKEYFC